LKYIRIRIYKKHVTSKIALNCWVGYKNQYWVGYKNQQGQFYMRLHRTTVVLPPEEIKVF